GDGVWPGSGPRGSTGCGVDMFEFSSHGVRSKMAARTTGTVGRARIVQAQRVFHCRNTKEPVMHKDEIKGKAEQAKGVVKEKVGEWTNDPELEAEGVVDQATGTVRENVGAAKRKVEESVNEVTKDRTR